MPQALSGKKELYVGIVQNIIGPNYYPCHTSAAARDFQIKIPQQKKDRQKQSKNFVTAV